MLPTIIPSERCGEPVSIGSLYAAVERDHPELVDDEIEPGTNALHWRHQLRWALETLIVKNEIRRRNGLGRGMYSL